jgi:hypothetical protein
MMAGVCAGSTSKRKYLPFVDVVIVGVVGRILFVLNNLSAFTDIANMVQIERA